MPTNGGSPGSPPSRPAPARLQGLDHLSLQAMVLGRVMALAEQDELGPRQPVEQLPLVELTRRLNPDRVVVGARDRHHRFPRAHRCRHNLQHDLIRRIRGQPTEDEIIRHVDSASARIGNRDRTQKAQRARTGIPHRIGKRLPGIIDLAQGIDCPGCDHGRAARHRDIRRTSTGTGRLARPYRAAGRAVAVSRPAVLDPARAGGRIGGLVNDHRSPLGDRAAAG